MVRWTGKSFEIERDARRAATCRRRALLRLPSRCPCPPRSPCGGCRGSAEWCGGRGSPSRSNAMPVEQQRAEGERFSGCPVDVLALLDRLAAVVEEALNGAVDVEVLRDRTRCPSSSNVQKASASPVAQSMSLPSSIALRRLSRKR